MTKIQSNNCSNSGNSEFSALVISIDRVNLNQITINLSVENNIVSKMCSYFLTKLRSELVESRMHNIMLYYKAQLRCVLPITLISYVIGNKMQGRIVLEMVQVSGYHFLFWSEANNSKCDYNNIYFDWSIRTSISVSVRIVFVYSCGLKSLVVLIYLIITSYPSIITSLDTQH